MMIFKFILCFSFIYRHGEEARERHKLLGEISNLSLDTAESNLAASRSVTPTSTDSISAASSLPETEKARFDGFENAHWPSNDDKKCQSRCKLKGCNGQTHVYCGKCSTDGKMVHLCFTKQRNCFTNYHNPNY